MHSWVSCLHRAWSLAGKNTCSQWASVRTVYAQEADRAWSSLYANASVLFTPTTSRIQVLDIWHAFIFPLHHPNMKKALLKCSKMTAYNNRCCVPFISVLNFVFCAYTPCGFRDYFVPEIVSVGHGEELSMLVETGSVQCIVGRGIATLGGRCVTMSAVELCLSLPFSRHLAM